MAKENWKIFEENTVNFINENLKIDGVKAVASGGSDSTNSDIKIEKKGKLLFSIECKLSPAQGSQFVVHNDLVNQKFILSTKNKYPTNADKLILNHMNENYKYYSQGPKDDSSNIDIDLICDKSLMFQRVRLHTELKYSVFIASSTHKSDFTSSYPLYFFRPSDLHNWFNVTGKYRTKQSGTGQLPMKYEEDVRNYFCKNKIIIKIENKKRKTYIYDLHNKLQPYIKINQLSLFLQVANSEGYREIKKRSITKNANVIFSLELLNHSSKNSNLDLLREYINQVS